MIKNTYPGKLIVFEGLDGSGQSTQANLLKDFLLKKDYQVFLTKEPTLTSGSGRKIREILTKKLKIESLKLQELFVQDRKEHLENEIIPALKDNKIVISDRYFFSTFAYGAAEGIDLDLLIKMNDNFFLPDITFLLKVSPKVCLGRIEKRNEEKTLFEEKEKLAKVWETYKILPTRFENVYIIDGEKSVEEVFEQIQKIINQKLNIL